MRGIGKRPQAPNCSPIEIRKYSFQEFVLQERETVSYGRRYPFICRGNVPGSDQATPSPTPGH
jgi:hypothetical protein